MIERYIGIPYKLNGRDLSGVDCVGLVCLFFKNEFKIEIPDNDGKPVDDDWQKSADARHRYEKGILDGASKIKQKTVWYYKDLTDYDVACFEVKGIVVYMGIFLKKWGLLTINERVKSSHVQHLWDDWERRFKFGFRLCRQQSQP